ncbi:TPA: hypothetical protein HA338_11100 [Methanosarcina acetivorans]|uniref:Uncharacterized protein n=1 Tax=Methanosarcina acetivorans TaxID=2214 RepID=A0A832SJT7_9EURY|nr:hypothetical protein [Methanosarcina acetivorans]HIH94540.1 hypothetical protein [Methanosarcina acetivorans]
MKEFNYPAQVDTRKNSITINIPLRKMTWLSQEENNRENKWLKSLWNSGSSLSGKNNIYTENLFTLPS